MTTQNNAAKPLAGSVALVTGGSRGIGRAIALRLAALGAHLAICGRDHGALENVALLLRQSGVRAFAAVADISLAAQVTGLVERTEADLGPISILVNNAGIGCFGPAQERSEEEWDRVLDTNLKGVFLMSRAVAPSMIRRRAGQIINISSLAGKNAFAGGAIYCASKWGLQGLTACMAEDWRGYGIRVSAICPGSVATDFSPHANKDTSKMLQPEDVAHAVELLVTQGPQSFLSNVELRPLQKP